MNSNNIKRFCKIFFTLSLLWLWPAYAYAQIDYKQSFVNVVWSTNCDDPTKMATIYKESSTGIKKYYYQLGSGKGHWDVKKIYPVGSNQISIEFITQENEYGTDLIEINDQGGKLINRKINNNLLFRDGKNLRSNESSQIITKCLEGSAVYKSIFEKNSSSSNNNQNTNNALMTAEPSTSKGPSLYEAALAGRENINDFDVAIKNAVKKFADKSIVIANFSGSPIIKANSDNKTANFQVPIKIEWTSEFKTELDYLLGLAKNFPKERSRIPKDQIESLIYCHRENIIDAKIYQNDNPVWNLSYSRISQTGSNFPSNSTQNNRLNIFLEKNLTPIATYLGSYEFSVGLGSSNIPVTLLQNGAEVKLNIELVPISRPFTSQSFSCK